MNDAVKDIYVIEFQYGFREVPYAARYFASRSAAERALEAWVVEKQREYEPCDAGLTPTGAIVFVDGNIKQEEAFMYTATLED